MQWPSLSLIISKIFLTYIIYSLFTLYSLLVIPSCEKGKLCLSSYLHTNTQFQLHIYSSVMEKPLKREANYLYMQQNFDYTQTQNM